MTDSAIIALAAAFAIAISTIFPALGQGRTAAAAMDRYIQSGKAE